MGQQGGMGGIAPQLQQFAAQSAMVNPSSQVDSYVGQQQYASGTTSEPIPVLQQPPVYTSTSTSAQPESLGQFGNLSSDLFSQMQVSATDQSIDSPGMV